MNKTFCVYISQSLKRKKEYSLDPTIHNSHSGIVCTPLLGFYISILPFLVSLSCLNNKGSKHDKRCKGRHI